eukprot:GHRR01025143.1.p1 GENE.GHRR01025143.1~~GHRR01025143.1.p1  ORF type:complete len:204 (+),score=48.63 GHRR01025143.1:120-731(+)
MWCCVATLYGTVCRLLRYRSELIYRATSVHIITDLLLLVLLLMSSCVPAIRPPVTGYVSDYDGSYYPAPPQQQMYPNVPSPYGPDGRLLTPVVAGQQPAHRQQPTGARLKVTRCVQLKAPENKRALLDFGIGVGVDLDRQEVHGVARLKVADLLSIKLLPQPLLKLGGAWSLPGTGMALRLKYEAPLVHLNEFWQPPARLMVR